MVTSRTATRREGRLGEGGVAQEQILDGEGGGLTQRGRGFFTSRTATRSSSSAHSILKRLSTTKALLRLSHLDKEKTK